MTANQQRRVIMARKSQIGEDSDFSLEFWDAVGAEGRFAATWDAVVDLVRMGKLDADQLRLRRSIPRIERR